MEYLEMKGKGGSHAKHHVEHHGAKEVHHHHMKKGGKVHRKWGGKVDGNEPKARLDKRARGGRMTPKSPLSGATVSNKSYAHDSIPSVNEGGKGEEVHRARGGGIHIKKSHEGLLHKDLGVAEGKKIPAGALEAAAHSKNPAERKRAVFAENAKKWHH